MASQSSPLWSSESGPPPGYLSRKALPIKKDDAEPLTRDDVQFDLLNHIFTSNKAVFTDPFNIKGKADAVTFSDLYISALFNSAKCSKVLKDKMVDTPAFAVELGKISLLTNVGRINTTMAFFPEMKTALRTYHPVPSLQKTDGNAQDAPRIKNCLKAALLPAESTGMPPATPEEILEKRVSSPSFNTHATQLIQFFFVTSEQDGIHPQVWSTSSSFWQHMLQSPLSNVHFDSNFNFLDLFIPGKGLASYERAQAFLWCIYHYLENSNGPNPFSDKYAESNPGKAPQLRRLSTAESQGENVDTSEEVQWGRAMSSKRNTFLHQLVSSIDHERRSGKSNSTPLFISVTPENGPGRRSQRNTPKEEASFLYYVPSQSSPTSTRRSERPQGSRNHPLTTVTEAEVAPAPRLQQRSMVNHAWLVATSTDPLEDSDGERGEGEHVLLDYARRLRVLRRIETSDPGGTRRTLQNRIQ